MCVAVPGRVVWVGEVTPAAIPGRIAVGGVERDVDLIMVPEAGVGDYVVAHSGYAIRLLPEHRAREALDLLRRPADGTFSTTEPA